MTKDTLSIKIAKNCITVVPIWADVKGNGNELENLKGFLTQFIMYVYSGQEITVITYGTSYGDYYRDFENTITAPENGIPKIDYYLSFTNCTEGFIEKMLKEDEYLMDSIYLTSLKKKDAKLLQETLKEDLKVNIDTIEVGDFSHIATGTFPDFYIPVGDGNGFEIYNLSFPIEDVVNKIKEISSKYNFEISL